MSRRIGLLLSGALAVTASAADRVVLVEDFTATWCGPCHVAGAELKRLVADLNGTLLVLNPHIADVFETYYTRPRVQTLGYTGYIPHVVYDTTYALVGTRYYTEYKNWHDQCQSVPTDTKVQIGGALVLDKTFKFTVRLTMDATGTAKTLRVFLVRLLDNYPDPPPQYDCYSNCIMEWMQPEYATVSLSPGQSADVTYNFTFDDYSWSRQNDMKVAAWAEDDTTGFPRQVHNAYVTKYPFGGLGKKGDLNCDDTVNFADINPFVLALSNPDEYRKQFPNCDITNGDCNGDGQINFGDINPFVELLSR